MGCNFMTWQPIRISIISWGMIVKTIFEKGNYSYWYTCKVDMNICTFIWMKGGEKKKKEQQKVERKDMVWN